MAQDSKELMPTDLDTFGLGPYLINYRLSFNGAIGYLRFYFPRNVWESFNFYDGEQILQNIRPFFSSITVEYDKSAGSFQDLTPPEYRGVSVTLKK